MTVYKATGTEYQPIPQIKMQGDWLQKSGFSIGDPIQIKCRRNKLIITKAEISQ
ncbi:MAG: type I toxin-antitoxin system SymE family toxin [Lachnospiraceae bacterium]|nr:type I toxin-antitoxin system SymE family toxin [Lachnospiraceae bacterium]